MTASGEEQLDEAQQKKISSETILEISLDLCKKIGENSISFTRAPAVIRLVVRVRSQSCVYSLVYTELEWKTVRVSKLGYSPCILPSPLYTSLCLFFSFLFFPLYNSGRIMPQQTGEGSCKLPLTTSHLQNAAQTGGRDTKLEVAFVRHTCNSEHLFPQLICNSFLSFVCRILSSSCRAINIHKTSLQIYVSVHQVIKPGQDFSTKAF